VVGELSKLVVSSGALTQDDGSGKARLMGKFIPNKPGKIIPYNVNPGLINP